MIESDSPPRVAERLEAAGCTLLGPWAADSSATAQKLGLSEELDVSVLIEAGDSAAATEQLREIVGAEARFQVLKVVPADAGPDE